MELKMQLLKLPRVIEKTGLGRSSIYAKVATGEFPAPVRLSARAIAWRADAVESWVESRPSTRAAKAGE
jgi:prophage regulatory protein